MNKLPDKLHEIVMDFSPSLEEDVKKNVRAPFEYCLQCTICSKKLKTLGRLDRVFEYFKELKELDFLKFYWGGYNSKKKSLMVVFDQNKCIEYYHQNLAVK